MTHLTPGIDSNNEPKNFFILYSLYTGKHAPWLFSLFLGYSGYPGYKHTQTSSNVIFKERKKKEKKLSHLKQLFHPGSINPFMP